jgi:uncharacterized paraquat-inducible protein A
MKHYTKNTVSVQAWCNKCKTHTYHRVDGGRRGPCIRCIEKLEEKHALKAAKAALPVATQSSLFGGR